MKPRNLLLGMLFLIFSTIQNSQSFAAVYKTTNTGGIWTSPTTWQGGVVPNSPLDTVIIRGNLEINTNVTTGYVQVDSVGILQGSNFGTYQISTGIGLTNYGIIKNNAYNLTVNLNGFLKQYGSMTNYQLILNGPTTDIDAKEPISCASIYDPAGTNNVNILSDTLEFNNTILNINACLITFNNGVWIQNGGAIIYPKIYSDQLEMNLNSGAYLQGFNCYADQVTLNGTIDINSATFHPNGSTLVVESNGLLRNKDNGNYTMTVEGDFINNGTIQNNYYNFTLDLKGDITNNGTWSNFVTNLKGAGNQNLALNQPFNGQYLTSLNGGHIVATSNLVFNNTFVDLNGDTLFYNNSLSPVTLNGGYMREFVMVGNAAPFEVTISLNSDAFVFSSVFDYNNVFTTSTFQFQTGLTINGNLIVQGTFQNDDNNIQTANINGNIINDGIIKDNYYNLTINVTGDLTNNGTWSNYFTYLTGAMDQTLSFSQPFDGEIFTNSNIVGKILTSTNLHFNNNTVDFNNDTLIFSGAADSLYLNNSNLKNCKFIRESVKASGDMKFNLVNNSYLSNTNVEADNITLFGTCWFSSNMNFYGNVFVEGTLQNHSSSNYAAYVYGNLTNNGIISNNFYNLNLYITGDIHQNGQWQNFFTYLTGSLDQHLFFTQDFNGSYLTNSNIAGKIISHTNLKFNNTLFEMMNDTLVFAGVADSLVINQNYLNAAVIIRDDAAKASGTMKLFLMNTAYVQNLNVFADEIKLYGIYQFSQIMNFYGNVTVYGTLQNRDNGNFTANMSSNLVNKGIIKNNYYNLTLNIAGNLWQQGSWTCFTTNLNGASDQILNFNNDFNGQYFTNTNNDGKIIANTDLIFNNTIVDLNNDTLEFAGAADSLKLNGQYLIDAIVIREAAKASGGLKYNLTGGAYTNNLITAADEILLYGIFQFSFTMQFYGNVTVMDLFQNRDNGNFNAYIYGNLTNNGTITNNYYNLSLYLYGNVNQHGSWTAYYTYLSSASDQTIDLSQPFSGSFFVDNNAGSSIITTSDLVFQGLSVDLNGAALIMPPNAVLAVKGGYLRETDITNKIELYMDGDSYIENVSLISPTFSGTVQLRNNIAISGHVIVNGVLQNDDVNTYNVTINGSLENHGTIQDNYYQLRLFIQEDILNNGSWTNTYTQLEGYSGSINQTVELQDGHYITGQLKLFSNNSTNFLWYKNNAPLSGNPDYTGASSQILTFNVPADNIRAGVYNCNTLAGWSRNIIITTTSSDYPIIDLTVILEGPFNGIDMNTDLNDNGSLPISQPYDDYPNNYFGTENVASIPDPNIVDWVLIEFRDAVDGNNANQSTRVNRQPAFLLSDGSVVGIDGSSFLTVPHNFIHNVFVLVHHRNHLGVMSAVQLNEVGGVYSYDFSYDTWNSYGGPNASKNIGTDLSPIYGMMGGDADGNGVVDSGDYEIWKLKAGNKSIYEGADVDCNGEINNLDKNDVWYENKNAQTQYPQ